MPIEWKDVQKWLNDATNTAVKETKEIARKGKVQYDILTLRHQTTAALTELGSIAYELVQKGSAETLAADEKFKTVVGRIRELELELRHKEDERKTPKE